MDAPPGFPAGDPSISDRRFLRDLTSLLALPAFWTATDPVFVLRRFFEALESLLMLEVCYGDVRAGHARLRLLRLGGRDASTDAAAFAPIRAVADAEPFDETSTRIDVGGVAVSCLRLPIGYDWSTGHVVFGARRDTFPDPTELVIVRAGLSLAAAGLETARLVRERDEAHRAKDEFLAMLGHELRNPLAPIVTALALLDRKLDRGQYRELQIMDRQVKHLRRLVDDLLDVSRITRGKIELQLEPVDMADVVERAVEAVSPLVHQARHELVVDVPAGTVVRADVLRLVQVITNLLTNAVKYTPSGGQLAITVDADGPHVRLRVRDNGTGLSPELLPHVFDLFVQGRRDLSRSEGGLGIGLAIARQLMVAHGGQVLAESDGPGRGSVFTVVLPRADVAAATPGHDAPPTAASAAPVRRHVLVVDDNHDAAELAATVLAGEGHVVTVAHSGAEALQRLTARAPDVAILDIGLPDIDGYAVAAALRARYPRSQLRIVALTGYGRAEDEARSQSAGFDVHLTKPVDPHRLIAVVSQLFTAAQGA